MKNMYGWIRGAAGVGNPRVAKRVMFGEGDKPIRGSVVVILVFDLVSPTRYLVLTYLADWEFEAAELSRVSQRSCKAHWSGPVLLHTAR
jgi:hypothetical protein